MAGICGLSRLLWIKQMIIADSHYGPSRVPRLDAWACLGKAFFLLLFFLHVSGVQNTVVNLSSANLGGFSSHRLTLTAGDARKMGWKMASTFRAREPRSRLQNRTPHFFHGFHEWRNLFQEGKECWFQFLITLMCRCCHFPDCTPQDTSLAYLQASVPTRCIAYKMVTKKIQK